MTYCREKDAYGGTCGSPENYYGGMCAEHRIRTLEARVKELEELNSPSWREMHLQAMGELNKAKARAEAAEADAEDARKRCSPPNCYNASHEHLKAKLAEAEKDLPPRCPPGYTCYYRKWPQKARRAQEAKP